MKRQPVHEQLGCMGYFGFGFGWVAQTRAKRGKRPTAACYCATRCPVTADCWALHRARTREYLPKLCRLIDQMINDGKTNPEIAHIFGENETPIPHRAVMLANRDGGMWHCAEVEGEQRDHGPLTLREFPLPPCEWAAEDGGV